MRKMTSKGVVNQCEHCRKKLPMKSDAWYCSVRCAKADDEARERYERKHKIDRY